MQTQTNRHRKMLFVLLLALSMLLAACAGGSESNEQKDGKKENDKEETTEGKKGGDLILAVLSDASSLDPAGSNDVSSSNIHANIYETLVKRDENNEIVAGLAGKWQIVDETTYEFTLRKGVTFHDGEPLTAEAVKKSFERILDPKVASSRFFLYEMITEINAIDELTVQFKLSYPFAPFLAHLTHNGGSIISPKLIDEDYAAMEKGEDPGSVISSKPVGTGYFKFDSWTPGSEIRLVRNDQYWGDPVHVDSVTFKVIPESATRLAELQTGQVHIADPLQPNEVDLVANSDYGTVHQKPSSSMAYLGFNTEKEPFNNPKVRQAISMLVNKEDISEGVYEGFGLLAKGPLAPGTFGYNEDAQPIAYDPEEAKKLLAEAGYADGFKTSIWTNDNPQRQQIAVLVQEKLKQVNIDVEINVMEFGAYLKKTANAEHDMFILGWSNPTGDADYGMYALFHSAQKGEPGNRSFYSNPEVDRLLDEGRRETNPDKRVEIYHKAQELLIQDAPLVYLIHTEYLTGISNQITGFSIDDSGIYQLKEVQFVK